MNFECQDKKRMNDALAKRRAAAIKKRNKELKDKAVIKK